MPKRQTSTVASDQAELQSRLKSKFGTSSFSRLFAEVEDRLGTLAVGRSTVYQYWKGKPIRQDLRSLIDSVIDGTYTTDEYERALVAHLLEVAPHADRNKGLSANPSLEIVIPFAIRKIQMSPGITKNMNPVLVANLFYQTGLHLTAEGKVGTAEKVFRDALDFLPEKPEHKGVRSLYYNDLGNSLWYHDPRKAEIAHRLALKIRTEVFGAEHPLVSQSRNNLACALRYQQDYVSANELQILAIEKWKIALGPDDNEVGWGLSNAAMIKSANGYHDEAFHMLTEAEAIKQIALNDAFHQELTFVWNNMVRVLIAQGRYDSAKEIATRSLHVREDAELPGSIGVLQSRSLYSQCLVAEGRYTEALRQIELCLEAKIDVEHPELKLVRNLEKMVKKSRDKPRNSRNRDRVTRP